MMGEKELLSKLADFEAGKLNDEEVQIFEDSLTKIKSPHPALRQWKSYFSSLKSPEVPEVSENFLAELRGRIRQMQPQSRSLWERWLGFRPAPEFMGLAFTLLLIVGITFTTWIQDLSSQKYRAVEQVHEKSAETPREESSVGRQEEPGDSLATMANKKEEVVEEMKVAVKPQSLEKPKSPEPVRVKELAKAGEWKKTLKTDKTEKMGKGKKEKSRALLGDLAENSGASQGAARLQPSALKKAAPKPETATPKEKTVVASKPAAKPGAQKKEEPPSSVVAKESETVAAEMYDMEITAEEESGAPESSSLKRTKVAAPPQAKRSASTAGKISDEDVLKKDAPVSPQKENLDDAVSSQTVFTTVLSADSVAAILRGEGLVVLKLDAKTLQIFIPYNRVAAVLKKLKKIGVLDPSSPRIPKVDPVNLKIEIRSR